MYVCLCNCVTDRQLVDAAADFVPPPGMGDSASIAELVADRLGAGLGCGSCREFALDLVERAASRQASVVLPDHVPAPIALENPLRGSCDLPIRTTIVRSDDALASQGG